MKALHCSNQSVVCYPLAQCHILEQNEGPTLFQPVSGLLPTGAVPYPRTNVKVATPPTERQTLSNPLNNIHNEDSSTTTLQPSGSNSVQECALSVCPHLINLCYLTDIGKRDKIFLAEFL